MIGHFQWGLGKKLENKQYKFEFKEEFSAYTSNLGYMP
jgi:hypothetical protein